MRARGGQLQGGGLTCGWRERGAGYTARAGQDLHTQDIVLVSSFHAAASVRKNSRDRSYALLHRQVLKPLALGSCLDYLLILRFHVTFRRVLDHGALRIGASKEQNIILDHFKF